MTNPKKPKPRKNLSNVIDLAVHRKARDARAVGEIVAMLGCPDVNNPPPAFIAMLIENEIAQLRCKLAPLGLPADITTACATVEVFAVAADTRRRDAACDLISDWIPTASGDDHRALKMWLRGLADRFVLRHTGQPPPPGTFDDLFGKLVAST